MASSLPISDWTNEETQVPSMPRSIRRTFSESPVRAAVGITILPSKGEDLLRLPCGLRFPWPPRPVRSARWSAGFPRGAQVQPSRTSSGEQRLRQPCGQRLPWPLRPVRSVRKPAGSPRGAQMRPTKIFFSGEPRLRRPCGRRLPWPLRPVRLMRRTAGYHRGAQVRPSRTFPGKHSICQRTLRHAHMTLPPAALLRATSPVGRIAEVSPRAIKPPAGVGSTTTARRMGIARQP